MNTLYKQMLERGMRNRARAKMYRAKGKTYREIGVLLGLTPQAVHKSLNKAKGKK
jgi:predicted transcriptional regulator